MRTHSFMTCLVILVLVAAAPVAVRADHVPQADCPGDAWGKEPGIRLDFSGADPVGTFGFHTPYVFRFPDGTLRMYYDALGSGEMRSATSTDGLAWSKEPGTRLTGGAHPHVLEVSPGFYRMYFETPTDVLSATSADGLAWSVEPGIRVANARDPVVVELAGDMLRMYVRRGVNLLSATSADGLVWVMDPGVRVTGGREFAVMQQCDGTVILYFGQAAPAFATIQSARAADGLNFVVDPTPALVPGGHPDSDPLESGAVLTTSILVTGDVIRMYYQGAPGANINDQARVFSAVCLAPVNPSQPSSPRSPASPCSPVSSAG